MYRFRVANVTKKERERESEWETCSRGEGPAASDDGRWEYIHWYIYCVYVCGWAYNTCTCVCVCNIIRNVFDFRFLITYLCVLYSGVYSFWSYETAKTMYYRKNRTICAFSQQLYSPAYILYIYIGKCLKLWKKIKIIIKIDKRKSAFIYNTVYRFRYRFHFARRPCGTRSSRPYTVGVQRIDSAPPTVCQNITQTAHVLPSRSRGCCERRLHVRRFKCPGRSSKKKKQLPENNSCWQIIERRRKV
jgi:hypothetical protein